MLVLFLFTVSHKLLFVQTFVSVRYCCYTSGSEKEVMNSLSHSGWDKTQLLSSEFLGFMKYLPSVAYSICYVYEMTICGCRIWFTEMCETKKQSFTFVMLGVVCMMWRRMSMKILSVDKYQCESFQTLWPVESSNHVVHVKAKITLW